MEPTVEVELPHVHQSLEVTAVSIRFMLICIWLIVQFSNALLRYDTAGYSVVVPLDVVWVALLTEYDNPKLVVKKAEVG